MDAPGGGLSQPYVANVADFLDLAAQNNVYVILTQDWLPDGKYADELNKECCASFDSGNLLRLSRAGVKAYQLFYTDFIGMLDALNARTDVIFGYELSNELFFDNDRPPLSLTSGLVTAANFKTYDMSLPGKKDQMIAEAMPYWMNSIRGTIASTTRRPGHSGFLSSTPSPGTSTNAWRCLRRRPSGFDGRLHRSAHVQAARRSK
jgi:hypothetical protein